MKTPGQDEGPPAGRTRGGKKAGKTTGRHGLLIVNTGDGKGKTTAALGLLLRAWGRGMRVVVLQFIKHTGSRFGETRALAKIGVETIALGDGFTWLSQDLERSAALARELWLVARQRINEGGDDVILLDEITYPMQFGWIDVAEVVATLRGRPADLHVVCTGRGAPQPLLDAADLVTEMRQVKHPYHDQGIRAQPGIEY